VTFTEINNANLAPVLVGDLITSLNVVADHSPKGLYEEQKKLKTEED